MASKTLAIFALLILSFSLGAAAIYEGSLDVSTGDGSIYIGPAGGGGNGCQEAWSCSWSECVDSSQTYICTDLNNCGTQNIIPAQNGEVQTCTIGGGSGGGGSSGGGGGGSSGDGGDDDMPADNAGLSGTDSCTENWLCDKWSNDDDQCGERECFDNNMCGTEELKPFTEKVCENTRASRITGAVTGVTETVFNTPGIYVPLIFVFLILAGGLALILAKKK